MDALKEIKVRRVLFFFGSKKLQMLTLVLLRNHLFFLLCMDEAVP